MGGEVCPRCKMVGALSWYDDNQETNEPVTTEAEAQKKPDDIFITKCPKCGGTTFKVHETIIHEALIDTENGSGGLDIGGNGDTAGADLVFCHGCDWEGHVSQFKEINF